MSFLSVYKNFSWEEIISKIESITLKDVELSLSKEKRTPWDFLNLISKPGEVYLEEMAKISQQITLKRYGKVMQLYTPMYLSNECTNVCTYCGFSLENDIPRITLTFDQIEKEAKYLKGKGFDHILLLTGEAPGVVDLSYFKQALQIMRKYFSHISLEVQPLEVEDYRKLSKIGLDGVVVYQESYRKSTYRCYHPKGKKSHFDYRVETPDRLGEVEMRKIGLGVLLGLEDWRIESFFTAIHLDYLKKRYWKSGYSISFPRIKPAKGVNVPKESISDRELVQLIVAWRLLDEDLDLHLTTRETSYFRDNVFNLGITSMSAGSKTYPGGYSCFTEKKGLEQFENSDHREINEVAAMIKKRGYDPITKDWDRVFF